MVQLMGILNVTPDSFSDGGKYLELSKAVQRGIDMYTEGATILDIGGESTRPGSFEVSEKEEVARVVPVIEALHSKVPIPISIDTKKALVAEKALEAGACFVNDVSGFQDPAMLELVIDRQCELCVMHMKGEPRTMQNHTEYEDGILNTLLAWFEQRINFLVKKGVLLRNMYIDPGIGFGKSAEDCLKIIKNIHLFKSFGAKVCVGLSRKSFISNILNKKNPDLLSTTISMNTIALVAEVDMIRVHDVKSHRDVIDLLQAYIQVPRV